MRYHVFVKNTEKSPFCARRSSVCGRDGGRVFCLNQHETAESGNICVFVETANLLSSPAVPNQYVIPFLVKTCENR